MWIRRRRRRARKTKRCTKGAQSVTVRVVAQGSVYRKAGGWAFRVDAGFHPETGKRRQVLRQGFATKKAAQEALNDLASASARGQVVTRSTISVQDYLAEWLATTRSKLRPSTHHSYAMSVDRIVAHLGRYQLQSLTPLQIERFYTEQLESGGRERGPLSPKTVRNTHVVLRKALADAERLELVPRNAAAAARPPAPERRDMTTWSSDDLGTFLAGIDDVRYSIGFRLLAATGMRRGEVLGLRWRDVDLDLGRLAVAHTITTAGHDIVMGPPKTPRSRRNVDLDRRTVTALREHRKVQRERRLSAGPAWDGTIRPRRLRRTRPADPPGRVLQRVRTLRSRAPTAEDPPARPPPHPRHPCAQSGRPSKGGLRASRTRHDLGHTRPLHRGHPVHCQGRRRGHHGRGVQVHEIGRFGPVAANAGPRDRSWRGQCIADGLSPMAGRQRPRSAQLER